MKRGDCRYRRFFSKYNIERMLLRDCGGWFVVDSSLEAEERSEPLDSLPAVDRVDVLPGVRIGDAGVLGYSHRSLVVGAVCLSDIDKRDGQVFSCKKTRRE